MTPQEQAEAYCKKVQATGMSGEFSMSTLVTRAFQDGMAASPLVPSQTPLSDYVDSLMRERACLESDNRELRVKLSDARAQIERLLDDVQTPSPRPSFDVHAKVEGGL